MRFRSGICTAVVLIVGALSGATLCSPTPCSAQKADSPPTMQKAVMQKAAMQKAANEAPSRLALRGGTVLTATGPAIAAGVVLIEAGKIVAVGADLAIPDGTEVVDVTGKFVFPGLIDAGGVVGLPAAEAASKVAGTAVRDGLDPFDRSWAAVLSGGVTAAFVAPRVGGPPTGTLGAVVKIRPGVAPERAVLAEVAAVRAAVGVSSTMFTSDTVSRWRSAEALEKTLEGVRTYVTAREKYRKDLAKFEKNLADWRKKVGIPAPGTAAKVPPSGKAALSEKKKAAPSEKKKAAPPEKKKAAPPEKKAAGKKKVDGGAKKGAKTGKKPQKPPKRPKAPREPKLDPVKEALADVLERKIPLRVEAHRLEDIERTLDIAEKFKLRLVLEGATEAGAVATRLAANETAVVAGPLLLFDPRRLAYERYDPAVLGTLARAGVCVAVGSVSSRPTAARFLRLAAARAEACGLDRDTALAAVTRDAAKVLGVADRIGSLAAGKDADLVVADRHPLDTGCRIERVYIDGKLVHGATRP